MPRDRLTMIVNGNRFGQLMLLIRHNSPSLVSSKPSVCFTLLPESRSIQGGGKGVHDEWDNKLVASLERELGPGYEIRYPRMPNEADPKYALWKAALKKEFAKFDDGAILVGHSIGGTILINVLAEEPPDSSPSGIFLVAAPFVGKGGWSSEDIKPISDLGARLQARWKVYLYHGSEDDTAPFGHIDLYEKVIPQAVVRRLAGCNHQLNDDMSEVLDIRRLE